eukprot:349801-Chlamydomonas_euryale.AAC.59
MSKDRGAHAVRSVIGLCCDRSQQEAARQLLVAKSRRATLLTDCSNAGQFEHASVHRCIGGIDVTNRGARPSEACFLGGARGPRRGRRRRAASGRASQSRADARAAADAAPEAAVPAAAAAAAAGAAAAAAAAVAAADAVTAAVAAPSSPPPSTAAAAAAAARQRRHAGAARVRRRLIRRELGKRRPARWYASGAADGRAPRLRARRRQRRPRPACRGSLAVVR